MSVRAVTPADDRAKLVRKALARSVRSALRTHSNDVAGFALVTWDMRGSVESSFLCESGMVSPSLMPSYVKDALNRHVAVLTAQTSTSKPTSKDDD